MSSASGASIIAVGVLFPLFGLAAVTLRLLARRRRLIEWETDDWLCVPALVMVIACGIILIVGSAERVLGYDISTPGLPGVNEPGLQKMLEKLCLAFDIIQTMALACIEASAIFLYRRLFPGRGFNITCAVIGGFVAQWFLTFIGAILYCGVRRLQQFQQSSSQFTANNSAVDALLVALSVENIVINTALLVLPMAILLRLQLPVRKVVCIAAVFLAGAVAVCFGIIKVALPATTQLSPEDSVLNLATGILTADNPRAVAVYMLWGMAELGGLLVVVCLPALGHFLDHMLLADVPRSWRRRSSTATEEKNMFGIEVESTQPQGRLGDPERGPSITSVASMLCPEPQVEVDPNYKFMESHVSMIYLRPQGQREREVSPAPKGTIMVQNKIIQTYETVETV